MMGEVRDIKMVDGWDVMAWQGSAEKERAMVDEGSLQKCEEKSIS